MAGIAIGPPPDERGHEIAPAGNGGQTPFSRPQHHENERPGVSRKGLSVPISGLPISGLPVSASQEQAIPRFEAFYYLELLRRIGWIDRLPDEVVIRLDGVEDAAEAGRGRMRALGLSGEIVGVSPGAAYGTAKQWLPERFAEAAVRIAKEKGFEVALFGSAAERPLCEQVRERIERHGVSVHNLAGETTLYEFIDLAAACRVFLTNDSGAMHIASALGVPTVAIFGATDEFATGPTGGRARVVREPVECSPCLMRECPIDHRCMTRVSSERVALTALELLK
jgi:heptosyltransferase-2